jgi:hypothetical protein
LNLVKAFTVFLVKVSKAVLEFLKFNVLEKNFKTLRISNAAGVVVNPSCLGWGIMSFWIAFVYANKGGVKRKLKWIFCWYRTHSWIKHLPDSFDGDSRIQKVVFYY